MSFSFEITDYVKNHPQASLPHQHVCAFEPSSGFIWIAFVDRDASGVIHRYFYRSTDDSSFTQMADWQIGDAGDDLDSFDPPTLSFVIDAEGGYIYAVTDTKQYTGHSYIDNLYYGRLDLRDIASGFQIAIQIDTKTTDNELVRIFQNYDIILDHRPQRQEKPVIAATKLNIATSNNEGKLYWTGANGSPVTTDISTGTTFLDNKLSLVDDRTNDYWYIHGSRISTSYAYRGGFQANGAPYVWVSGSFDGVEVGLPGADMALGEGMVGILTYKAGILQFATFDGTDVSTIEELTEASQTIETGAYSICYRAGYWHSLFGTGGELVYKVRSPQGIWAIGNGTIILPSGTWTFIGISNPPNVYPRDEYEFGAVMVKFGGATYPVVHKHIDDWFDAPVLPTGNYWKYGDLTGSKCFGVDVETDAITELTGNSRLRIIDTVEFEGDVLFSDQKIIMQFKENFYKEYLDANEPGYTNREFLIELPPRRRLGNAWKCCNRVQSEYEMGGLGFQISYLDVVNEDGDIVTVELDGTNSMKPVDILLWGRQFNAILRDDTEYSFKVNFARLDGFYDGNRA